MKNINELLEESLGINEQKHSWEESYDGQYEWKKSKSYLIIKTENGVEGYYYFLDDKQLERWFYEYTGTAFVDIERTTIIDSVRNMSPGEHYDVYENYPHLKEDLVVIKYK